VWTLAACGNTLPPDPLVVTKIVYQRLEVAPERVAPLPIPSPPQRGAALGDVKTAAAACYATLRAANADRAFLARELAAQPAPK